MELPASVLAALEGHTMKLERREVGSDFPTSGKAETLSRVYAEAPIIMRATAFEEPALIEGPGKPAFYFPRLFGIRISGEEAKDEVKVLQTAQKIYAEIDRIFLPSSTEYRDGGLPGDKERENAILRVIEWIPMELVPLPLMAETEYIVRVVLNVEHRFGVDNDLVQYLMQDKAVNLY